MSEYDVDDELEGQDGSDLVKNLRKQLKTAQKERDELRKQAEEALKGLNERRLQEVLAERGISDQRIGKLMLSNGVDVADEAKIDGWLKDYGDLFGVQQAQDTQENQTAQQQYQRMANVERQAIPPEENERISQIRDFKDPDELAKFLSQQKSPMM